MFYERIEKKGKRLMHHHQPTGKEECITSYTYPTSLRRPHNLQKDIPGLSYRRNDSLNQQQHGGNSLCHKGKGGKGGNLHYHKGKRGNGGNHEL